MEACSAITLIGQEIQGIRLSNLVDQGPRSFVFLGEQTVLQRKVAIKALRPHLASDAGFRRDFCEAGRSASHLVHPGSVSIINVFDDPKIAMIVMEWLPLLSLDKAKKNLSELQTCQLALDLLDAMASIHMTGRKHGNLMPSNLMLTPDNTFKITDFFHQPVIPGYRNEKRITFTAPEILNGDDGDWRSDLYSISRLIRYVHPEPMKLFPEIDEIIRLWGQVNPDDRADTPEEERDVVRHLSSIIRSISGNDHNAIIRRQYRRLPASFKTSIRQFSSSSAHTGSFLSNLRNIGENGVYVSTPEPLSLGTVVEMKIDLAGGDRPVRVVGVVRWAKADGDDPGMGVQFVEVAAEERNRLRDFLEGRRTTRVTARIQESDSLCRIVGELAYRNDSLVSLVELAYSAGVDAMDTLELLAQLEKIGLAEIVDDSVRFTMPTDKRLLTRVLEMTRRAEKLRDKTD